ncbi:MAG: hypothetical protein ACYC96_10900 [Fimbriimonadaceae bacterium]
MKAQISDPGNDLEEYLDREHFAEVSTFVMELLETEEEECATDEEIAFFIRGELVEPDLLLVGNHLKSCPECQRRRDQQLEM